MDQSTTATPGPAGSWSARTAPGGVGYVAAVTIDCADPEKLAQFWGTMLGLIPGRRDGAFVELGAPPAGLPSMIFQAVPEAKVGKARAHVDVVVDDLEGAVARAVGLGATTADDIDSPDNRWQVMRDPEGNEFCLVPRG